jgi:hypothetical protein
MLRNHILYGSVEECVTELNNLETKGVQSFAFLIKEKTFEEKRKALETFAQLIINPTKG